MVNSKTNILNANLPPELAWGILGTIAAVFIGLFLSFQAGVFLLIFLIAGWWVWHNPESGFLWLIILAPALPMLRITETIGTLTLVKDVVILILFAKVFLIPLLRKKLPYRRSFLFLPIIGLGIWTAWATLHAESALLGILRARDIILYVLLYFIALYLPINKKILKERIIWFGLSLLTILGLGVYQWIAAADSAVLRFDPAREIWIPRVSSIMAHPSILGQFLVTAASIFGALFFLGRNKKVRFLSFITVAVSAVFIFLTYSRAVWFGFAGSIGIISIIGIYTSWFDSYVRKLNKKNLYNSMAVIFAAGILILMILVKFTPAGVFIRTAFDPTYGSNEERIEFMARLIAPLSNVEAMAGRGLGNVIAQQFRTVDIKTYDIATASARTVQAAKDRTLVDNQFLKTFIEMGLAGLLIYGWIFWLCLKNSFLLTTHKGKKNTRKLIGLAGLGFFIAFVIQGFFIDIWEIWPTNAAFWIMAGLVGASMNTDHILAKH